jgi:hypothetical protein
MTVVFPYVEIAIPVLLSGISLAAQHGLVEINYRPDSFGHNYVAFAVYELHRSKKLRIGYKIT